MILFGIVLMLASSVTHAAEPEFVVLKKGQNAPFDGRLFNSEAVSKLIVENRYKAQQCNIEIEYHKGRAKAEEKYKYDTLYAKCEADDQRLTDLLEIKKNENEQLKKLIKPSKSNLWAAGGFVAGVLTSIGIMHAVK